MATSSNTNASPPLDESRTRLAKHFQQNVDKHPSLWDDLWKAGDFLPWDRGGPNPALIDTLTSKKSILGGPFTLALDEGVDNATTKGDGSGNDELKRRKKALVPGCGRGYDVLLLASFGYDAVGVEASEAAVEAARKEQAKVEKMGEYPVADQGTGRGNVMFVKGDFFDDGWVKEVKAEEGFDIIYDYTFLSALPPSLRPAWSSRMSTLLSPTGHLICLEFPTYKDPSLGGPPWALPPVVYEQHLARPGEEIPYDDMGNVIVVQEAAEKGNDATLVRFDHWKPERTHEIGKGTDWVSIWQHR